MKIIAFGHRRRMGKDTSADFMMSRMRIVYPTIKCQRSMFAGRLKDTAYSIYKWAGLEPGIYYENHPEFKDVILPAIGKSPRQIWIELGEKTREISDKTWPENMLQNADCDMLIASDLRHYSELEYVKMSRGCAIRVIRPGEQIFHEPVDDALGDYMDWDGILVNNAGLKELNEKVQRMIPMILADQKGWTL